MIKRILFCVFGLFDFFFGRAFSHVRYDVNLIGYLMDIKSVSRHTSSFVDCLGTQCQLKLFKTLPCDKKSLNTFHQKLIDEGIDLKNQKTLTRHIQKGLKLSGMTIYTQSLWKKAGAKNAFKEYSLIPNFSTLKFAYVVAEYTKIPHDEVRIFNKHFDALIIPDPWLESVYRTSGVKIPIFTLPLVLDLESLHKKPIKRKTTTPFVFGFSGVDPIRKNIRLLIKSFSQEFGNDPQVSLIIHSRFEDKLGYIEKIIKKAQCSRIKFIQEGFSRPEYEDFISALSCYVILSKGEGFSITPREALAAGIPCILSNNTAHKIICDTGYVAAVKSNILEPAYSNKKKGFMFNCTIKDTRKALRDVYQRYDHYVTCAQKGREWTKQYLVENLRAKYMNLVKPSKVILGKENKVTDEYLMVSSRTLFDKYRLLCTHSDTVFCE